MKNNKKDKSPKKGIDSREIERLERFYTIQVGEDFLEDEEGAFAFTEKEALLYQRSIVKGLKEMLEKGDDNERKEAKKMLSFIKVSPLKVQ